VPLQPLTPFFSYWRKWRSTDRQVVDAVVAASTPEEKRQLDAELEKWPGTYYWTNEGSTGRLTLIRPRGQPHKERWWLHILLFFVTFFTVWRAGDALVNRLQFSPLGPFDDPIGAIRALGLWAGTATDGFAFAAALMGILLLHELGHYVFARRYHINASPPFFIPAPAFLLIGTLGAFIRLRTAIWDRRQLFDVGAAGPWAGVLVSLVVLILGLQQSVVVPDAQALTPQFIYFGRMEFYLGDSLLMAALRGAVVGSGVVELHPLALAGWFGLLVTMINLIPLGQLDGGHIVFAMMGEKQRYVGQVMWYLLILFGFAFPGWWVWAVVILLMGRGRVAHPSVIDVHSPIPKSRWLLGFATGLLFIATFSIDPFPSLGLPFAG
jgi:Zn-dependent protease